MQEVCETTYLDILGQLGPPWSGRFRTAIATTPTRCGSDVDWGVAFLARSAISGWTWTLLGTETNGEKRWLTCGYVTVGGTFRLCTAHLSQSSANVGQVATIANTVNPFVDQGIAVMLGADLNINVGSYNCVEAPYLRPLYIGAFRAR